MGLELHSGEKMMTNNKDLGEMFLYLLFWPN